MRLPALEKNILVYRALQMAQFLFYSESLRKQLVSTVGASLATKKKKELKGSKLLREIFKLLEDDKSLTNSESTEIQALLEHRNRIAHEIHLLTGDIEIPGRNYRFKKYLKLKYDYEALEKIKKWHKELWRRISRRHILKLSFDSLLFEAAEHAYERELIALRKRIDRQFLARKKTIKNEGA